MCLLLTGGCWYVVGGKAGLTVLKIFNKLTSECNEKLFEVICNWPKT
jgi:hypothetical protein